MTIAATEILQTGETQEVVTTFAKYGLTWAIYIGLVLLMVGIIWYGIRKWHFTVKWFIASIILAGALTPGHPVDYAETYSPLVLNSVVLLFDGDKVGFMAGAKTIVWVFVATFVSGLALWFAFRIWRKKSGSTATQNAPTVSKKEPSQARAPIEPSMDEDA